MFVGRQFFSWPIGSIYARALISRGLRVCFAEASLNRLSSRAYPPPESCQSCFLGLPLAKFAPFVLAVVSVDFTAQMPYQTFLGRHWPNSRQGLSCSRFTGPVWVLEAP